MFEKMTDRELVAFWNVLIMGKEMIGNNYLPIVGELLTKRNIPHEDGEKIETVLVDIETGIEVEVEEVEYKHAA